MLIYRGCEAIYKNNSGYNIHRQMSLQSDILCRVTKDDRLVLSSVQGEWGKIHPAMVYLLTIKGCKDFDLNIDGYTRIKMDSTVFWEIDTTATQAANKSALSSKFNRAGYSISLGNSSLTYDDKNCGTLYYCSRKLGNNPCGPLSGPQCPDCKGITSSSIFNRSGFLMVKSSKTVTFYCGRKLGKQLIPGSDGQCGPNDGPQCADCKFISDLQGGTKLGATFSIGDKIEANWKGRHWFAGIISKDHGNGTYDIDYADGDKEVSVSANNIRVPTENSVPKRYPPSTFVCCLADFEEIVS